MKNLPDQTEVAAENASLHLRARSLRAAVFQKSGEAVSSPQLPQDDALAANAALKSHIADLEQRLAGNGAAQVSGKKRTLTEKVLAARGVSSLAELHEKRQNRRTPSHVVGD